MRWRRRADPHWRPRAPGASGRAGRRVVFESGSMPARGSPARAQFARGTEPWRVSYSETLYALVRSGQALGLMPRLYTAPLRDPELAVVPLLEPRIERRVVLAYLPGPMRNMVRR